MAAMPIQRPGGESIAVAAMTGLGLGQLVAAIYLMVLAVRSQAVDCAALSAAECAFERQGAAQLGRMQAMASVALALMAVAVFLFLRAKRKSRAATHGEPT